MDKRIFSTLALAVSVLLLGSSASQATLWMPGDYQVANGTGGDWSPDVSPAFTDLGGGFHELALTGVNPAKGPGTSERYLVKILDDEGSAPAAWGDPEVPENGQGSKNTWFVTDTSGNATVMVDRNTYGDGFLPATDRVTVSTDFTEFSSFFATGDFEVAAGGSADFSGGDPLFEMTDQGGGLWSADVMIATPGSYQFKAVAQGAGDFLYQWGTNGRLEDSANFEFFISAVDQEVTFMLDLSKGAIGFSSGTLVDGDTNGNGIVEFEPDFGPIRDNWLNETFLRSEGNIDNSGDSEGVVEIADFRQWKNACTAVSCASGAQISAAFSSLGVSVPEPGSAVLVALAGVMIAGRRRHRI